MAQVQSSGCFKVGAARVDITPPLVIPYLGYAALGRHQFFKGVHDPLYAKAVVADDGERRVALVVADSIGFARRRMMEGGRDFIGEVRERVMQHTHIPADHIMVCATHAHSTPETIGFRSLLTHPGAAAWLETLANQIASAVVMADARLAPASMKVARGCAEGVGYCRRILGKDGRLYHWCNRPPEAEIEDRGVNDHEVTVLRFEAMHGSPATILMHFACHPTTVQVQPLVSADFPGAATAFVERSGAGCEHCLYLQGASGSINPVRGTTDFSDVARYGQMLAGEVIRLTALASSPDYPVAGSRVDAASATVSLPSRELPRAAEVEARLLEARAALARATTEDGRQSSLGQLGLAEEVAERVGMGNQPFAGEVQVLRIGDVALIGIPAEPFAQLGLEIKRFPEALASLCVGYANDYLGYVAPPSEWERGGYEVSLGMWSIVGPEAYGMLLKTARDLVIRLFERG